MLGEAKSSSRREKIFTLWHQGGLLHVNSRVTLTHIESITYGKQECSSGPGTAFVTIRQEVKKMAKLVKDVEAAVGVAGYRFFEFIGETLKIGYKECQFAKLLFLRLID